MPWCDACSRFWNPNSVPPDGACPNCGRPLPEAPAERVRVDLKELAGEQARTPWHFKLLVVAVVAYLGWRAWELVAWVIDQL
jgi:hypothetical protein